MRHRKKKKILDRKKSAREALLRNLATSLILYEKIRTTKAKAKILRPIVERLITVGKRGDLSAIRKLRSFLYTEGAAKKVVEVLAPRYKERKGGYLRIVKLYPRKGDGAEMVRIEFI